MSTQGRIVVTTVNDKGQGVFEHDLDIKPDPLPGNANIRRIFTAPKVPFPGLRYSAVPEMGNIANKEGAEFVLTEMPPGVKSPMHATPLIDFGVILSGEVVLILDSGEESVLRAGDVYVQKSAPHAWENRGSEMVRLVVVLLASRP